MFDVHCPQHGSRVLLGARSIEALTNTDHGVVVHWRCRCGATGTRSFGARRNDDRTTTRAALASAA
ncbi:MAG: hypothetical protein ACRD0G_03550 [Acidimicrobiales bacterium]